jgi:hypothetical protein
MIRKTSLACPSSRSGAMFVVFWVTPMAEPYAQAVLPQIYQSALLKPLENVSQILNPPAVPDVFKPSAI